MGASDYTLNFLAGDGEMAQRIRAFDWARTGLGPVESWPQSLRSPLGMMLASKAQIVLFWGPDFTVIYNDAYRPVFADKHPHMLGRPGREAWAEVWDAPPHLGQLLEGVVCTGDAFWAQDLLFPIQRRGFLEDTFFDVSYDPVRDESGQVVGVYCIVTETTWRVLGEQRLALLRDLAARNTTARTAQEACALAMQAFAARPDDVMFALAYLDGVLQAATPGAEEARAAASELHVHRVPFARVGSAPPGELVVGLNPRRPFTGPYRDFAELLGGQLSTAVGNAEAYAHERRRAEELAQLDRAKTTFFGNVSHEFRTPLTLMLGPLEELLSREGSERDALLPVHRNGQRLLKLVNTLLDFASIEAGRANASFERIDVAAYTAELASNFRSACEKAGLALMIDVPATPLWAWVDSSMWEKIVLNLVSNAFKFTLQGNITVRITADGESMLSLTVADTGVGIPDGDLDRVFERFHRVEGQGGRTHEGSGIGLALVQELVHLHGGRIDVASRAGQGTTFTVRVPLSDKQLAADRRRADESETRRPSRSDAYVAEALGWLPHGAPETTAAAPTGAARILVVDDNSDMRAYLCRLLSAHYRVEAAGDGEEALRLAHKEIPDLVLADVMMPRVDGFGLIEALRRDADLTSVPVILVSARAGEEARLEGLQRGAAAYLVKPFTARELLGRVAAVLQADAIRREALAHEKRFRAFVQASSDVVYTMGPDWTEMRQLEGRSFVPDTVEPTRSWLDRYIFPEDQQSVLAAINAAIASKSIFEMEHRVRRVDGSVGWTFSRAVPLPDQDGHIREWLGAASDITARKAAEETLKGVDRRKDDFLATLSHELRNPLAPLRNGLHLLRMMGDDQQTLAVREMMERQLTQLVRLVDDLLELSRITRGTIELHLEAVEIPVVLRNAVETSEPAVRGGHHRLEVRPTEETLWVRGDAVRLAQILANLINNAAKYTEDGGHIAVSAQREGNHVVIRVKDNGEGIEAEALTRIFDMFIRDRRADKRGQGGLGIGLTLARHLAELHGGSLEAKSDGPGHGSTFTLRLPLLARPPRQKPRAPRATLEPGLQVLVVDDNRDAADSIASLLRTLGADVRVAHDADSALREYAAWYPRAMLLDLGMPGMDGFAVAERIRADFPQERTVLIALTGWGRTEDRRKAASSGFDHHLVKPADIDELCDLLAHVSSSRTRTSSHEFDS